MKISRIHILAAIICTVALVASCYDDSYHGAYALGKDDIVPIPVYVAVGTPLTPDTKSYGLVDSKDDFDDRMVYVYAFNTLEGTDYSVPSTANPEMCLVDASIDTPSSLAGKQARLTSASAYAIWTGEDTPYYLTDDFKSIPNRFFAYHIDSLQLSNSDIHRYRDSVCIDLHINGSQDIMSACGVVSEKESNPDSLFAFSYYSARKGIVPVFQMEHKLARLDFVITPGVQANHPKTIVLDSLCVKCPSRASLTVAHKDSLDHPIRFAPQPMEYFPLTERKGTPLRKDYYRLVTPIQEGQEAPLIDVGGCLLVPEMDSIEGLIHLLDNAEGMSENGYLSKFSISYPGGFKTGCRYQVKFTIYGCTYVDVSVTLIDWKTGGIIDLTDEPDNPGY